MQEMVYKQILSVALYIAVAHDFGWDSSPPLVSVYMLYMSQSSLQCLIICVTLLEVLWRSHYVDENDSKLVFNTLELTQLPS